MANDVAHKIERLRKAADVPVATVSKTLLGVSRTTYYNWLNEDHTIRKGKLKRMKYALKVLAYALKQGDLPVDKNFKGEEKIYQRMSALKTALNAVLGK